MPNLTLKIKQSMRAKNQEGIELFTSWQICFLGIDYWAP
jgi:hypothetical protein